MMDRLTALFDRRPETAADWLARMSRPDVDARDQTAFMNWLEAEPDHLRQYEAAKADSAALEPLRSMFAGDLLRLGATSSGAGARARGWPGLSIIAGGLLAATVAVAVLAWPMLRPAAPAGGRLYQSAPAQILDVTLGDGSRVTLDADSAIRVSLSDDVRRVEMERGAAYFEVAHRVDHPFQVGLAGRQVIVTGTRFVTSLGRTGGEVSLLEGQVAVGDRDAAEPNALAGAVRLSPGEKLELKPGGASRPVTADLDAATAWRNRRLVFRDAPLSEVVVAASRYADRPLVVADARLARTRVTAVLPLSGEDTLTERMDRLLPISVEETSDGRALIRVE